MKNTFIIITSSIQCLYCHREESISDAANSTQFCLEQVSTDRSYCDFVVTTLNVLTSGFTFLASR